ncbi:unnamed protein product, partial [Ascophyllum nodosum]
YIQQGRQGQGLRCLVVADNVWNHEVVRELRKTGMWIVITTRVQKIMTHSPNDPMENETMCVGVHKMVDDAKLILTRAANLPDDVQLPDAALEIVERCGHMAMDLAFVGSWDLVRERSDRAIWQDALGSITKAEQQLISSNDDGIMASNPANMRREAILRAGFDKLEPRVKTMYLSLAVMPDSHIFTVDHAAVLLYDRECIAEDKAAVKKLLGNLERWSMLESRNGRYKMHDAHANNARERLQRTEDLRACAVQRWTRFLSTLAALLCFDSNILMDLCSAVSRVGGDGRVISRQWKNKVEAMEDSNSHLFQALQKLGVFLRDAKRYDEAAEVLMKALEIRKAKLGEDDLPVAYTLHSLGVCLRDAERYDKAEELLRQALEIKKVKLGEDDLQVAVTMHELGVCLRDAERYDKAEELLRQALEIKKVKLGEDDLQVAVTMHELGVC